MFSYHSAEELRAIPYIDVVGNSWHIHSEILYQVVVGGLLVLFRIFVLLATCCVVL